MELNVSRTVTEAYKVYLAGGGLLLALLWTWIPRKYAIQMLVALTVISGLNYMRWGLESSTVRLDAYDVMHYYVNAKYFDELGYLDLYPAVILVDHENDGPFFEAGPVYLAQDESGHNRRPMRHALARGQAVKDAEFTPERWEQFSHDVLYLQRTIGCRERKRSNSSKCAREFDDKMWRQMIQDHGFNGTVVWTMVAEPITTMVPVEAVKLLGYLDVALLAIGFGAVFWAFGLAPTLWTLTFFLLSYSLRWPTITWVFLRYDWVGALLLTAAFLKKGHPLVAGLFAAWSATLRFFPALWMWGPFMKGVAGLTRKVVHRPLLVFAGGFFVGVLVLQGAALIRYGPTPAKVHFENMLDHNAPKELSSRRIGMALAMTHQLVPPEELPTLLTPQRREALEDQKPVRYGLALLMMLALGVGLRKSSDDEAWGYGFLPFFLLTTASYYYYIARLTLALAHASDLSKGRNRFGLAWLLGLELFSNWAEGTYNEHRMFLVGNLALGLAVYTVIMALWLNFDAWRNCELDAGRTVDEEAA